MTQTKLPPEKPGRFSAQNLSSTGGSTHFANTYAAWDDLLEDEKQKYDGMRVVHSFELSQRFVNPEPTSRELKFRQSKTPKIHPLVWTHKSGRKSLVLGSTAHYIEGMDHAEGRRLLNHLREWATQPQFVYTHHWTKGDLHVRGTKRRNFVCAFHGWTYDLEGKNTYILDPQDWHGALTPERTCLSEVQVDTSWGGYIYINMDHDGVSLREWMGRAGEILNHFELDEMSYKWRQWAIYPCNWKVAIEAFLEPYHVAGTHTQLLAYGDLYAYSKQYGLHSVSGYDTHDEKFKMSESSGTVRAGKGDDPRVSTYELIRENYETVNFTASTETLVKAASRLVDELPADATPTECIGHWRESAKRDDAARGVIWPEVPPDIQNESGLAWGLWPNQNILHRVTFGLCYRVRPYGDDPNKCIFESYALERFPEGEAPQTEWVYAEATGENWGSVLAQDFSNMEFVQKGMKSSGFRGTLPNPHQEQKVINLHRNLAEFMGRGVPRTLD